MNKRTMIGIAAGAAVLAGAALYIAKRRSDSKNNSDINNAKQNFKSKLDELQRKAGKELRNVSGDAKDVINSAKERANEWVNNASKA